MLFIFAVLSSVVALVAAQGASSPLPKDAKDALKFINEANDETMADVVIKGKKCFKKADPMTWFDKALIGFEKQFNDRQKDIDQLGKAPTFGCDGVLNAQLKKYDCLTFVCLYRKQ
uniref:Uncharacterized protein n=1 Tax=Haemonchus contortus TaxID=6289 RepID=U6PM16_HAECO|nr:unnamed protein product [Haemonchus contortus]